MKKIIFLVLLSIVFKANAQPFSQDLGFNINYNFYFLSHPCVFGMLFEPDGKLMVYGEIDNPYMTNSMLRINTQGERDTSWHYVGAGDINFMQRVSQGYLCRGGGLGILTFDGSNNIVSWYNNIMNAQTSRQYNFPYIYADGSMLVGDDSTGNIPNSRCLVRFHPDGTRDTTFKHSTNYPVYGISSYPGNNLLLYGLGNPPFFMYDTTHIMAFCRIDSTGVLDTSFHSIFTYWGYHKPLYVQNDGKIIVAGSFTIQGNSNILNIVRLMPDGSLDSSFNNYSTLGNPYLNIIHTVCKTPDDGYLIGGSFTQYQGYERHSIVKTDGNGFIDTNYFNGVGFDSVYRDTESLPAVLFIARDNQDRYYCTGNFYYYNGNLVQPVIRLNGMYNAIPEETPDDTSFSLYPNPAGDEVNIRLSRAFKIQYIQIYDVTGKLFRMILPEDNGGGVRIPTASLPPGFYLVRLSGVNGKSLTSKLIKL